MKRNMKKNIEDFGKMVRKKGGWRYDFTVKELLDILEVSEDQFDVCVNSLKAGFMSGYKAGKRDRKKGGK